MTNPEANVATLGRSLMQAVVNSGCIRSADQDAALAVRVMREELKAFLNLEGGERYADERALIETGGQALAWASLVARTVARITEEREA